LEEVGHVLGQSGDTVGIDFADFGMERKCLWLHQLIRRAIERRRKWIGTTGAYKDHVGGVGESVEVDQFLDLSR